MRERRLDAVRRVVGERERDRAGGRDRAVVREARADRLELLDELRRDLGEAAHVAAVARMQHAARHAVAGLPAVAGHLGTLAQHRAGDRELLVHDRRRPLLAGELEPRLPARDRHLARDVVGEGDRLRRAVLHAEHRDRRAEAQEPHAVAALAGDLVPLAAERQAVDLDHVVEHAREGAHHLAVLVPVEARLVRERPAHEARQVDRAEQAGAVGRQRLLAAGIGGADVLAPPVVVHLVDAVDEDEPGLGEIVGGRHDDVPQAARRQRLVDLAGDEALVVRRRSPPRPAIRARRRRPHPPGRAAPGRIRAATAGKRASTRGRRARRR